jgi:hypothetical protein
MQKQVIPGLSVSFPSPGLLKREGTGVLFDSKSDFSLIGHGILAKEAPDFIISEHVSSLYSQTV